jgi:hypothetical protein
VSAPLARTDAILDESAAAVETASVEQDAALRQQAVAADEAAAADTRAGEAAKGMGASKVDVKSFQSKSVNSPFDGWTLQGRAVATIVAGRVKYRLG